MFFSGFNKLSNLLYYKQIQVVVQPMIESGLGFLMFITFWIPHHITTSGCYVWIFSSFNVMVYQVAKHSNVQPMVECCDRIQRKMICVQMFLYIANSHNRHKTATVFNHKLYFVLNATIKCIWIKTQLIVEFNLGFQDFANIIQPSPPPKKKSTTYGWIPGQFCAGNRTQTNIFTPWHVFVCGRKQRPRSTIGCIMLQTQYHDANLY